MKLPFRAPFFILIKINQMFNLKGSYMQTAILRSQSKSDLKLLLELAQKIGIKTKIFSDEEIEEMGLALAIKDGITGKYVDTEEFLEKLHK